MLPDAMPISRDAFISVLYVDGLELLEVPHGVVPALHGLVPDDVAVAQLDDAARALAAKIRRHQIAPLGAIESIRYFIARGYIKRRTEEALDYIAQLLPMAVGSVDRLEEIPDRLHFVFDFDPASSLRRDDVMHGLRERGAREVIVDTEAGEKRLALLSREGARYTFRAAMGEPTELRKQANGLDDEAAWFMKIVDEANFREHVIDSGQRSPRHRYKDADSQSS